MPSGHPGLVHAFEGGYARHAIRMGGKFKGVTIMDSPEMNRPGVHREWVFFRDLSGGWCWEFREAGKTVRESARSYGTRDECVADATANGFDVHH
jgi:hypothetical protein